MRREEGDVVAYSKFAGTEVEIGEMDHVLLKEEDCIGVMPGDITTLAPLSDRVVIKVRQAPTASPPLLPHPHTIARQTQLRLAGRARQRWMGCAGGQRLACCTQRG